ncbi:MULTISPECIES: dienelactone hydrolase family protein [unclassified Streptomyces]|uniref:dienelactone hydrolase family protein n=1 Tax=unclassified Streptomyces TaxID=2593676 RepID=UPI0016610AEF|nr:MULTISPECIES: dienelactone hydrolase family protein [unclassified Streptomyces]MBD0711095.1 alpha/beta hydrolase [Streptomyces sp. CBMA291]MBD0714427.1 alpha/beta hydrolase [Streptomyces sp. CBMA370]
MAHIALVGASDARRPRLGRPVGGSRPSSAGGVVLLLPDGEPVSGRRASARAHAAVLPLGRALARAGRSDDLVTHVVRYRGRGWNGTDANLAADASWAVAEAVRRYGDVPVCLVGHGLGARAALRAAGHDAVDAVLALAPWLPEDDVAAEPEAVRQLVGRRVMLVHGTNDAVTDPELSFRFAERAKKANRDTCRFEVHSDGHGLRQYASEVRALAADFVLGALFARPVARPVTDAMAAPPPLGLRMPLAAGFAGSRRR